MAKLTINGNKVKIKNGSTILQAARSIGIDIPTLCFIEEINEIGFCRMCVVEVEGEQDLVSACNSEVKNGMVVNTDSDVVRKSREATLQLLAANHRFDCWRCPKDGMCEFYDTLKQHDVVFEEFGPGSARLDEMVQGTAVTQDQSKCILCKRCVAVCQYVVTAKVLKFNDDDGLNPFVSPVALTFDESGCIGCGQCIKACPTGTLFETNHTDRVISFLRSETDHVVVQLDKQANSAIAEEFGYPFDTPIEETIGKTYKALELLGFDTITNTDVGDDIHAIKTADEFIDRLNNGGTFPLFASSCPAVNQFIEFHHPDRLEHLAPVKTGHAIEGALLKHELLNVPAKNVKVVTIGTCSAKKMEIERDELVTEGIKDVDAALTVREIAKLIKQKGINYRSLEGQTPVNKFTFDNPVFTGGNLVATLNAISEKLSGKPLTAIDFKVTKGGLVSDGIIEEATVQIGTNKFLVARVFGGAAFQELFAKTDKKKYHLVELKMCPGGCMNGGGMPVINNLPTHDVIERRTQATCASDAPMSNPLHNEYVQSLEWDMVEPHSTTQYSKKEFTKS